MFCVGNEIVRQKVFRDARVRENNIQTGYVIRSNVQNVLLATVATYRVVYRKSESSSGSLHHNHQKWDPCAINEQHLLCCHSLRTLKFLGYSVSNKLLRIKQAC